MPKILVFCLCLIISLPAYALPDKELSADFDTHMSSAMKDAEDKKGAPLTSDEVEKALKDSADSWLKDNPGGDKKLDLQQLIRLREIQEDPYKEGDGELGGDQFAHEVAKEFAKLHPDLGSDAKTPQELVQARLFLAEMTGEIDMGDGSDLDADNNKKIDKIYEDAFDDWYEENGYENVVEYVDHKLLKFDIDNMSGGMSKEESDKLEEKRQKAIDNAVDDWKEQNPDDPMEPPTKPSQSDFTDEKGNKVTKYANGAIYVEKLNGVEITINPDGSRLIERPDGTVEHWTNTEDGGERIIHHPDGTTTTEERPWGVRRDQNYDYEGPEHEQDSFRGGEEAEMPIYLGENRRLGAKVVTTEDLIWGDEIKVKDHHVDPLNSDDQRTAGRSTSGITLDPTETSDVRVMTDELGNKVTEFGNGTGTLEVEKPNGTRLVIYPEGDRWIFRADGSSEHWLNGTRFITNANGSKEQKPEPPMIRNDHPYDFEGPEYDNGVHIDPYLYPIYFGANQNIRIMGANVVSEENDGGIFKLPENEPRNSGTADLLAGTAALEVKESTALVPVIDAGLNNLPALPPAKGNVYLFEDNILMGSDNIPMPVYTGSGGSEEDQIRVTFITKGNILVNDDIHYRDSLDKNVEDTVNPHDDAFALVALEPKDKNDSVIDWGNGFKTGFTQNGSSTNGSNGEIAIDQNGQLSCFDENGNSTFNQQNRSYNDPLIEFAELDLTTPQSFNQINPASGNGIFVDGAPTIDILVNDRIAQVIDGVAPFFFDISEFLGVYNITNKTGFLNQPGFTTLTITLFDPATGEVQITPNDPVVPPVVGGVDLENGVFGARVPTPPPNVEIQNGSFTKLPGNVLQLEGLYDDADIVMQGNIEAQK